MRTTGKPDPNPRPSQGIFSRITSRWRSIVIVWLLFTVPIIYAIYVFEQPRFEAYSVLRVAPHSLTLFEPSKPPEEIDPKNVAPFMVTQAGLITSDRVLGSAIASPDVRNLSAITSLTDPIAELKKNLNVSIVPDSYLIRIALDMPDGNQAAQILNAVVHSYLQYHVEHERSVHSTLRKSLADQLEKYKVQIDEKRAELRKIMERGKVDPHTGYHAIGALSEEQSDRVAQEMLDTRLELINAQATLEATEAVDGAENDPRVRQRLSDLRINVAALVKRQEHLAKQFDGLKVERKAKNDDTFEASFVNRQIEILMQRENQVNAHLKQLEFEAEHGDYRVTLLDSARPPRTLVNNRRIAYMAAAPIIVLLALLSFALLVPVKGSRAWAGE